MARVYSLRACGTCREPFQPKSAKGQFCSVRCRLVAHVAVGDDPFCCWPWTAGRHSAGYGHVSDNDGRNGYAHIETYKETYGPVPAGHYVCHSCDNPPCCNPNHLFSGTPTDNVVDMYSKGRQGDRNYASGDRHGKRKHLLRGVA